MFFMAEYINMVNISALATVLGFWKSWWPAGLLEPLVGPVVAGLLGPIVFFLLKLALFIFLYIWLRVPLPRLRFDRLMNLGWKVLFPLALANPILTASSSRSGRQESGLFVVRKVLWPTSKSSRHLSRPTPSPRRSLTSRPSPRDWADSAHHAHQTGDHAVPGATPGPAGPHRGRELERHANGLEKCVGCELCALACPAKAIYVEGAENPPDAPISIGERYAKTAVYELRSGVSSTDTASKRVPQRQYSLKALSWLTTRANP